MGLATNCHDLRIGRVVSDKHPDGIPHIEFVGDTFNLLKAIVVLMQILTSARHADCPLAAIEYHSQSG